MVQPDALEHEQFSENTPALHINIHNSTLVIWQRGVVVSCVRRTNKVNARRARLVLGWVSSGGYTVWACNQPTRETQPCIPPGPPNRVPASAGVKAGMSALSGGR